MKNKIKKEKKNDILLMVINQNGSKNYVINKTKKMLFYTLILTIILALSITILSTVFLYSKYKEYKVFIKNNKDIVAIREKIRKEDLAKQKEKEILSTLSLKNINNLPMEKKMIFMELIPSRIPFATSHDITSPFGIRVHPVTGETKEHKGLDFRANEGEAVLSPAIGKVVFAGQQGGYGNVVKIEHSFGFETTYGHLKSIKVSNGQIVGRGEVIAESGNTGTSTGPHLHYEIKYNGEAINPINFINWDVNKLDEIFKKEAKVKWESLIAIVERS